LELVVEVEDAAAGKVAAGHDVCLAPESGRDVHQFGGDGA
jgi:hypothetical protein